MPMTAFVAPDLSDELQAEVAAIGRIEAVPRLLKVLCQTTGMGFAAVARVADGHWIACAVEDTIDFGLLPGGQLDVHTTLCKEVMGSMEPIAIDHASIDPTYHGHPTPFQYGIESYVSVPIVLEDGRYFGNLCAIDTRPARVSEPRIVATFTLFAQLVALELGADRKRETARLALADEVATGELREQFIAVLGHDLRNPLAAIAACNYTVQRKADDPETVRRLTGKIAGYIRRMTHLIDDIADFTRGRLGGGLRVGNQAVTDIGPALEEVVTELADANPDRRIAFDIRVEGSLHGDRGRLQQVLSNLLANAIRHGAAEGPIEVSAVTDGPYLILSVQNMGEPIPPESIDKIFGPFWRAGSSHGGEGLGLGLHICEQIVKAHGGRLSVTSTREEGTRFTAQMPVMAVG